MSEMVKVSVIIPVYNMGKYLKECLDSVVNQTLKDIEIICIDDGSTDSSLGILRFYAKLDSRIIVCSQENQGAGAARNKGLEIAKGKYIAFMDPDDFYPDEFVLNDLYVAAIENNVDVVGGSLIEVLPDSKYRSDYSVGDGRKFHKDRLMNYSEYQYDYYYQRFLYSKELLIKNNITFPLYRRHQDVLFFVSAMVVASKFYAMKRSTYCYRINHKTVIWTKEIAIDIVSAINEVIKITKEYELNALHKRVVNRLIVQYAENVFVFLGFENIRVLLHQVISDVRFELFSEKYFKKNLNVFKRTSLFYKKINASKNFKDVEVLVDNRRLGDSKVSVIIPVYNVEKYLKDCLDSVINQTLKDIELICVNDGSTDNSLNILREYADKDNRIVVLNQENRGLSVARNIGVENALGEYLYFLDSDDKIRLCALEKLYNLAMKEKLDVLYFDAESFFESNQIKNKNIHYDNYYKRTGEYKKVMSGSELFVKMVSNNDYRTQVSLHFINGRFYKNNELQFMPGILHEDNLFAAECMLCAERVMHIPEALFLRRIRENSIMTTTKIFANSYGFFKSAVKLITFLDNKEFNEITKKSIHKIFVDMLSTSRNIYNKLNSDEQAVLNYLDPLERELFIRMVSDEGIKNNGILGATNESTLKANLKRVIHCYREHGLKITIYKIVNRIMFRT